MTSSPSEVGRITLERVTFRYLEQSKRPVLDEVSASFDRSRITVLTGPSGCGKSTLLYLAAGIYPQNAGFLQEGTVRVEGQEPAALGPGERCALVGMLFQNPELQFCMDTVENELFFCLENRRVPRAEMEERLSAALDFCGIAHLRRRPLRSLSGGEKQRAALACLAALRPAWILLDEPFANLDDQTAALLCGQLARLHRECGTGILAIDHRLDHWLSIADEIRLMAQDGTLDGAAYAPSALSPQAWAERGVSVPGCPYQAARPVKTGPEEVVLSLRGLRVSQDGREVLRDVNADFFRGRIHAIVGPSGSGKSTLFGALSGLYRYQGSARLEGMELSRHRRRLTGRMGFVTQSPQDQFVADTVLDEVTVSLRHGGRSRRRGRRGAPPDPALALPPPVPLYAQPGPAAAAGGGRPAGLRLPGAGVRRAHLRPGSRPHRRHHGRPPAGGGGAGPHPHPVHPRPGTGSGLRRHSLRAEGGEPV